MNNHHARGPLGWEQRVEAIENVMPNGQSHFWTKILLLPQRVASYRVSLAENFPLIKEILGWSCQNEELGRRSSTTLFFFSVSPQLYPSRLVWYS